MIVYGKKNIQIQITSSLEESEDGSDSSETGLILDRSDSTKSLVSNGIG